MSPARWAELSFRIHHPQDQIGLRDFQHLNSPDHLDLHAAMDTAIGYRVIATNPERTQADKEGRPAFIARHRFGSLW
jgi:hypothetical protein